MSLLTSRQSLALLVACSSVAFVPTIARAQDPASATTTNPDVENGKYKVEGVINSSAVYVRSGPSENDYPTMKLDKGAKVTFVGLRFDWLKILPPEGSFCYVAKAYVEKRGDGSVGRVTNTLNVRVGSSLNAMKTKVSAKLEPGADVTILGEQDEYFKIVPPEGVYLYVSKTFVDPVQAYAANQEPKPADAQQAPTVDQSATPPNANPDNTIAGNSAQSIPEVADPATQPSKPIETAMAPTTQPSEEAQAKAELEYDALEAQWQQTNKLPLDQQPIAEMLAGYQKLVDDNLLPESMRRMAEFRIGNLKLRSVDKDKYVTVKKAQEEMRQKQVALQAERVELEDRINKTGIEFYSALGTLRVSSLQQGSETLYRLTDPQNGRSVVYIRSNDPKVASLVGHFVGVQGAIIDDQQLSLKVISPTDIKPVDVSKVGVKVAAQLTPPSLMPRQTGTASTGSELKQ